MTVAELIESLKLLDPSLPVLTPGFDESGFDDITVKVRRMAKYPSRHTVWTMPEVTLYSDDRTDALSVFDTVVISFD